METVGQSSHANMVNLPDGPLKHSGTTLGTVVRVCIERYYEIFDEMRDVTEAIPTAELDDEMGRRTPAKRSSPSASKQDLSSPSTSPDMATSARNAPSKSRPSQDSQQQHTPVHKYQGRIRGRAGPPPSAASASMAMLAKVLADGAPDENQALLDRSGSQSRSYTNPSAIEDLPNHSSTEYPMASTSGAYRAPSVSMRSGAAGTNARSGSGPSGWTGGRGLLGMPKTRSIISIDRTNATIGPSEKAFSGRESIKLGRGAGGTVRKSASAGVVGVGVTANGFFTSPN